MYGLVPRPCLNSVIRRANLKPSRSEFFTTPERRSRAYRQWFMAFLPRLITAPLTRGISCGFLCVGVRGGASASLVLIPSHLDPGTTIFIHLRRSWTLRTIETVASSASMRGQFSHVSPAFHVGTVVGLSLTEPEQVLVPCRSSKSPSGR
jgi:hypothetical protein